MDVRRRCGYQCLKAILAGLLLSGLLAGCAGGAGRTVSVRDGERTEAVQMTAANFKFDPAVIKASPGEVLTLQIENVSGTGHNFTIKDPSGKIIRETELPEKSTQEVKIELPKAGVYPFYCDKPFHSTLGMEGRIEVE